MTVPWSIHGSYSARAYEVALQTAKNLYREEKYTELADHVKKSLHPINSTLQVRQQLGLLDFQCLAFMKMRNLDDSLAVAKSMIRLDKHSSLGYIRAVSIEKARGNYSTAMRYLDHGLARVPQIDGNLKHLTEQRSKLLQLATHAVVTARPTDPMTVLPLEVLQLVLSHLDYRHIVAMTRVSKSWKRVLSALEPLIDKLDFRQSRKQITYPELQAGLKRLLRPRILAIDKLSSAAGEIMSKKLDIWKTWTSLETIVLNDAKISPLSVPFGRMQLKSIHIGLERKIAITDLFRIIDRCPLLKEATFRRVNGEMTDPFPQHRGLEVLEIGNAFDLAAFSTLPDHFSNYPNLRSLTVNGAAFSSKSSWDLRQNPRLVKLDTYACMIRSISLPTSLEEWLWDGTEVRFFSLATSLNPPPTALPHLHTICFSGDNAVDALSFLKASNVQTGQLRRVGLHNRQNADIVTASSSRLDILNGAEQLSLESESLQDHHVEGFVSQYPDIHKLQLAAPRITGSFIVDLLKRPDHRLRKLVLKDCRKVTQDTVIWARSQGIDVEVHLGSIEVRGGRRMREGWF